MLMGARQNLAPYVKIVIPTIEGRKCVIDIVSKCMMK